MAAANVFIPDVAHLKIMDSIASESTVLPSQHPEKGKKLSRKTCPEQPVRT